MEPAPTINVGVMDSHQAVPKPHLLPLLQHDLFGSLRVVYLLQATMLHENSVHSVSRIGLERCTMLP